MKTSLLNVIRYAISSENNNANVRPYKKVNIIDILETINYDIDFLFDEAEDYQKMPSAEYITEHLLLEVELTHLNNVSCLDTYKLTLNEQNYLIELSNENGTPDSVIF
ncbi:MAG: hypothetical protein RSE41_00525 [Clostridia bacterium]